MTYEIALLEGMAEITEAHWDHLANPQGGVPVDPFTSHRFLLALDRSRSTGTGTGWLTRP